MSQKTYVVEMWCSRKVVLNTTKIPALWQKHDHSCYYLHNNYRCPGIRVIEGCDVVTEA